MTVSFSIMAHPSRLAHVDVLLLRLAEQGAPVVPVAVDELGEGALKTARRAWALRDPRATHHVVLQDDVSFCKNFVGAAIWHASLDPTSFFLSACPTKFRGSQAVMLPTKLIPPLLAWEVPERCRGYDDLWLDGFFRAHGLAVRYIVPTLVEHRGVARSLLGGHVGASVDYVGDDAVVKPPPPVAS